MKKYILIKAIIIASFVPAFSQPMESHVIDSLKKQYLTLSGTNKVDCLNLLAQTFSTANISKWSEKADSVYHYATIAYTEANKIDYKKGIAQSLANLGNSEFLRGIEFRISKQNDSVSVNAAEKYLTQAISTAKGINNDEILGRAYYDLADILYFKSKRQDLNIRGEYLKKAVYHFHKAGNEEKEGEACTWLCEDCSQKGYYEEGIEYCQRSMELAKKAITKTKTMEEKEYRNYLVQQSLADMADLYSAGGDYETAMNYVRQGRQFGIENKTDWEFEADIAGVFGGLGQYDSALFYMKQVTGKSPKQFYLEAGLGAIYLKTKNYDKALVVLLEAVDSLRKKGTNGRPVMAPLLNLGDAYCGKQNYKTAFKYAREGTDIAIKLGARPSAMDGYELLSRVYYHLGSNDSAYLYLLKYTQLKDSIQNKQFLWRLNNYKKTAEDEKKQAQLLLLNKDNKVKTLQLKQESQQKNLLLILFSALLLAGFFVYRSIALKRKTEKLQHEQLENKFKLQQLENKKKQAEFQQQAAELEMQALRAQMNPHFIFNCLSSINRIILKNESQAASDYLTRFSRLIRMVLINSQKAMIPLEDELQMLRLYLDMERLRFKNSFDYSIIFTNTIDEGAVFMPPLLLQPFCENAIWHGLMQKEGHGHLNVELSMQENILHCIISDDGIGRERAAALKSKSAEKEKSMGLAITAQRLALLNQNKNVQTYYTIEDNRDTNNQIAGTKVILKIAYKELEEQLA